MTKQRLTLLICSLLVVAGLFLWGQKPMVQPHPTVKTTKKSTPTAVVNIKDREIIDQIKAPLNRRPASLNYINHPSQDWEKKLTQLLKAQGGTSLKELEIKKERSLVWVRDENALLVESVVVSMKNNQDVSSSFRALVDSQTGKVLETWDRTVFDPMDKSAEFRFKLDPHYSN
jgi:hypothetical protein